MPLALNVIRKKGSVFCRKKFCHLGRTAQQKFGRTVLPNRTFGRSLLYSVHLLFIIYKVWWGMLYIHMKCAEEHTGWLAPHGSEGVRFDSLIASDDAQEWVGTSNQFCFNGIFLQVHCKDPWGANSSSSRQYYTQVMQSNIHRDSDLPRFLKKKLCWTFLRSENSDI